MILTGKAKEDFLKWFDLKYGDHVIHADVYNADISWEMLPEICKISFIIEWFDLEDKINFQDLYLEVFKYNFLMYPISSIQKETIIRVNEIYNTL